MERNLLALRRLAWEQVDWGSETSSEQRERVNRFVNRALLQLAADCPNAFFQRSGLLYTQPAAVPTLSTDTLSFLATADAWVAQTTLAFGTASAVVWPIARQWDGRILEIRDPTTGAWHQHRIRTTWRFTDQAITYTRISLYKPWHNATAAALVYRVRTPHYYLPADAIEAKTIRLEVAGNSRPLIVEGQRDAEEEFLADTLGNLPAAQPTRAFRREPFSIPAPTFRPTLTLPGGTVWAGPESQGKFDYLFTYTWGLRQQELQNPGARTQGALTPATTRYEPLWESAPSPVSAQATTVGTAIRLALPDVDFMQGFGDATTARYHQSGWNKRIYRRRITSSGGSNTSVETPNVFYLLDEIAGFTTTYDDTGVVTPDYHKRLAEVHGYQAIQMYPMPAAEYEVKLRYVGRPAALKDDSDVPEALHPDATTALVLRVAAYLYEAQGNRTAKQDALDEYNVELITLQKRYGDLRPADMPLTRRLARARPMRRRDWGGL